MKTSILICINSLRIGGTERVVSILLEHLKDVFDIHLALYNDVVEYEVPDNIKVFRMGQSSHESNVEMFLKGPALSYKLHRYCKQNRITTVVAFLNRPCYLAALMKKLWHFGGRIVMCQRTHQSTLVSYGNVFYRSLSNMLFKFSFSQADLVLANSFEIRNDLKNYLDEKVPVDVIYNPMDLEGIKRSSREPIDKIFESGLFHFIVLGGLRLEKNHSMLLKAFSHLPKGAAKLWIVGGGELELQLKTEADNLGLGSSVEFCGFITNPFPFLIKADCLVLPSRVEGFPNALLEALACGKAVISTDCLSGPREILEPGSIGSKNILDIEMAEYGILVPVDDPAKLAGAMTVVIENQTVREKYAENAAEAIKKFDIKYLKSGFVNAFSLSPVG